VDDDGDSYDNDLSDGINDFDDYYDL